MKTKRECIDCGKITTRRKRCTRCAKIHNKANVKELNKEWKKRNAEIDRRYQCQYHRDLREMQKFSKETGICFDGVPAFRNFKSIANLSLQKKENESVAEDSGISRREEEKEKKYLQNLSLCDTFKLPKRRRVKNHG